MTRPDAAALGNGIYWPPTRYGQRSASWPDRRGGSCLFLAARPTAQRMNDSRSGVILMSPAPPDPCKRWTLRGSRSSERGHGRHDGSPRHSRSGS
jgi:hypothetical protein